MVRTPKTPKHQKPLPPATPQKEAKARAPYPKSNGPWTPRQATEEIRKRASADDFTLWRTKHFIEQLEERDLIIGDALYVLRTGFVYEQPEESTWPNLFKYRMEGKSPNSGNRELRVVAIPEPDKNAIKAITGMWIDGDTQKS